MCVFIYRVSNKNIIFFYGNTWYLNTYDKKYTEKCKDGQIDRQIDRDGNISVCVILICNVHSI